jgi:hypothetical protein
MLGMIHALMRVSKVLAERSATGARQCPKFPLDTNKDPCCHAQPAAITLPPAEAVLIYFHTFASPPTNHYKKSCKDLKMKFDIALRQNCDQSASLVVNTKFCMKLEC